MANAEQLKWPHQDEAALNRFYGNPVGSHAYANEAWERKNIAFWVPPYPMFYSDAKKTPFKKGLRVHVKCHDAFTAGFTALLKKFGPAGISARRLDITGGTYNYRLERGGSRLSVHSWGCAIDIDPAHNPFPMKWRKGMLDPDAAVVLEEHGFTWRGRNADIDVMHFQLAHRVKP